MCNVLHFSTTSDEDFTKLTVYKFKVTRPDEQTDAAHLAHLEHPNKWYLECRYGGCSCHFRHYNRFFDDKETGAMIGLDDAEFLSPEDDPDVEDDEELVEDTGALYDLFTRILAEGHRLDVLDSWNGEDLYRVRTLPVSLSQVPRSAFRFFETCRFVLTP